MGQDTGNAYEHPLRPRQVSPEHFHIKSLSDSTLANPSGEHVTTDH